MAAMPATTGMSRLLSPTPPPPALPRFSALFSATPVFCLIPGRRHQSHLLTSTRHLGSLHLAHFARNARNATNVPGERKGVAVTPQEPEMSAAELKAYEEACAKLEGQEPDFWEGSSWNSLGFAMQYLWVFGVVVSIVACITAVRTYNLGATDFKNTEVFKEAIEYQVDGSEDTGSSVFDDATKEAP
ncbi:uncharacterized protein [Physcomitrium patens]|uniref:Uncharacterized protein n=1 Tax=Physcomitrium patens TaxID=3218 RepID=A0A2K1KN72_PHYPA|nr:uncharacterized protein LOC112281640 [Physcomitrium patens]XP_024374167.1 uncharacterized protein LOC112281643 [Physcomitrium patens]PNR55228.1 hypothetical protein PHYPA_006123 [Physcomitrium patens]PNR55236.1 hypothetical protein PHYPA_006131 [Physcomitrium patens]|eukprot:XP_024374164.1 uncharacterized protein LOC112281640 [Physcomitrella patens]